MPGGALIPPALPPIAPRNAPAKRSSNMRTGDEYQPSRFVGELALLDMTSESGALLRSGFTKWFPPGGRRAGWLTRGRPS